VPDPITSYLSPKVEVREQPDKGGYGAFAGGRIAAGELVAVWSGQIVTLDRWEQLPPEIQRHTIQVEEGLYLASLYPDEPADYINHSCDPNAGLSGQIVVVAMRDIAPGEEVCIDHAMCDGTPYDEFDCQCGAPHCRRRITGDDWLIPGLWERYNGYFSPYLQRRIERLSIGHPFDSAQGEAQAAAAGSGLSANTPTATAAPTRPPQH